MSPSRKTFSRSENMRGAGVTVGCFGAWAMNDALMKLVMLTVPELQTIFIRGLFVVPLLALIAQSRGELLRPIDRSNGRKVVGRIIGDIGTTYCVLAALHNGFLADVAVILGAQPLWIMLGAAVCLGETIDRVAWAIALVGMVGVVLVAQPGKLVAPSSSSLFALVAVAFGSLRDLLARQISSAVPATQIAALSAFSIMVTAGLVSAALGEWTAPSLLDAGLLALASALLAAAQIGSVVAMRTGDVGFVQPFRYAYIVFAMLLGLLLFGHSPEVSTLTGAAIVAGCGIGSLVRERRRGRLAPKGACRLEEEVAPAPAAADDAPHPKDEQLQHQTQTTAAQPAEGEGDQAMQAISSQCGVQITNQDLIRDSDGCAIGVFHFPEDEGETFSEWLIPWPCSAEEEDLYERLYEGHRGVLEPLLRQSWGRLGPSFEQLPNTAQWTLQRMEVGGNGKLMPVLRDDKRFYIVLRTSAECCARLGSLTIPDPYHGRDLEPWRVLDPSAGHSDYMACDTWFEDCEDGGTYVLGLDDTVLVFYVDGPGDMIYGRWQCSRAQWESTWLSAFGSLSVTVKS